MGYIYIEDTKHLLMSEAKIHIKEVAVQGSQLAQRQIEKDLDVLNIFLTIMLQIQIYLMRKNEKSFR